MATTNARLATSLAALQKLQRGGRRVFRSSELTRPHRERLLRHGFLQPVIKGWLMSSTPDAGPGDTTPWVSSFWEFVARYCSQRFGKNWHLAAEQSLLLHAENGAVPTQLVVLSPKGGNNTAALPFETTLLDIAAKRTPAAELTELPLASSIRVFTSASALTKVSESFFAQHPIDTQAVLATVTSAELLPRLLDGGHTVVAGRLAGALRHVGRGREADDILEAMRAAGAAPREKNPFIEPAVALPARTSAIAARVTGLWERSREAVLAVFPPPPGRPKNNKARRAYLSKLDERYQQDAYHSLSIEGYQVTPELIERVRQGTWDAAGNAQDQKSRDVLAARGYWQAFQKVRGTVEEIVSTTDAKAPGELLEKSHNLWYRELFAPSVAAGLLRASALAGYRDHPVYLRGSRHVPPRAEALTDAMGALFERLTEEPEPAVRAVLGHWLFGYVHPYPDGNGRVARFVMNGMLASGGYPWAVVPVDKRREYMAALEVASGQQNVEPFARFLARCSEGSP